jgi:hypothetical protein
VAIGSLVPQKCWIDRLTSQQLAHVPWQKKVTFVFVDRNPKCHNHHHKAAHLSVMQERRHEGLKSLCLSQPLSLARSLAPRISLRARVHDIHKWRQARLCFRHKGNWGGQRRTVGSLLTKHAHADQSESKQHPSSGSPLLTVQNNGPHKEMPVSVVLIDAFW